MFSMMLQIHCYSRRKSRCLSLLGTSGPCRPYTLQAPLSLQYEAVPVALYVALGEERDLRGRDHSLRHFVTRSSTRCLVFCCKTKPCNPSRSSVKTHYHCATLLACTAQNNVHLRICKPTSKHTVLLSPNGAAFMSPLAYLNSRDPPRTAQLSMKTTGNGAAPGRGAAGSA